jgi:DNA sulfur modification protein DndD
MIINSITLENFQSYFNQSTFHFDKGVNIVSGRNGAGKSKLFNAFYYVLFQSLYSEIQDDGWYIPSNSNRVKITNERAKKLCVQSDSITCKVILDLETIHYNDIFEDVVQYKFERGFSIKKINTDEYIIDKEEWFNIEIRLDNGETQNIPDDETQYLLRKIFPEAIRKYMWFQGETINELIDFRSGQALKDAIKNISYYPFYERIESICKNASKINEIEQTRAIKKLTLNQKEIGELTYRIENAENKIKHYNQDIEDSVKIITEASETLNKLEQNKDKLAEIETAKQSLTRWQAIKSEARRKQEESRTFIKNRFSTRWMFYGQDQKYLDLASKLSIMSDELHTAYNVNNPVPYFIPGKSHIERCISDEMCYFCEREAKQNSEGYISLQKRLQDADRFEFEKTQKQNKFKEVSEVLTVLKDNATSRSDLNAKIHREIENNQGKYNEAFNEYKRSSNEIKILEKQIEANAQMIGATDASRAFYQMRLKDTEIRNARNKQERANKEILILKSALEKDRKKFQELSEKIDDKNQNVIASKYFNLLVNASKILKERAHQKLLENISTKSNEIYGNFLQLSGAPQGKIVIEQYEVEIMDGDEIIDINKGHSTVAKMSVINSVLSLSAARMGKSYPLISDAPSSVFDGQNVASYTENIGKEFEQVIIMSKDYSDISVLQKLKDLKGVSRIYEIENIKASESSGESLSDYKTKITKLL